MQVNGFDKSVSQKAVWAEKKAVANGGKSGIMKSELGTFKKRIQTDEVMSDKYYTAVKSRFSHGSDVAKKAFNKFIPNNSVEITNFEGTAQYNLRTKKVYMNYSADLYNKRGSGVTWFHEHGHMLDDLAGNLSNNKEFRKLLDEDYMSYMKSYGKRNKLNTFDKVQNAISNDLNDMRKHSAVSDILEGISKGNIRGVAGHINGNPNYWSNDSILLSETFAHMFEAQFDRVRYEEMKKYFPNALKKFENMLEVAIK